MLPLAAARHDGRGGCCRPVSQRLKRAAFTDAIRWESQIMAEREELACSCLLLPLLLYTYKCSSIPKTYI